MTHTYQLTGMTCSSCEATVKNNLLGLPGITAVAVSKDSSTATISMAKHFSLTELQKAIGGPNSKYQISAINQPEKEEQRRSWFTIYKPIIILFSLITIVSSIASFYQNEFHLMEWMNYFMAGFFLSFSFFKLINLRGFAESYAMYDVIGKRFKYWGYIYAFIELSLGIAYLTDFYPLVINVITCSVMSVSLIGVLQSVLNKRKIQCACLGVVFNLPMSTVTIIEDALMILMSGVMIFWIPFS